VFIRIMRGRVVDGAGASFDLARWRQDLSASPPGWQRLTAGVTEDGEAVAMFRYDSEETARSSGERPQQAAWRASVERQLARPVVWYDCPVVNVMKAGDEGDAGFVQVMQGRLVDPVRLAAMRAEVERTLRERAPHVLGVSVAEHADGVGFTEVTYFTSEREARAGERQMPVEMAVQLGTVRSYMEGLEFLELREPVLAGPAVPVP
jgi:hypothetical protein